MKQKQLIILVVAAAVLAVFAYFINRSHDDAWRDGGETGGTTLLPADFDSAKISQVTVRSANQSITLEKKSDGWKVKDRYGYPANFAELKEFMYDLTETRIAQTLHVDESQREDLRLNPDQGAVTVTLADQDGQDLHTLVFGKKIEKESDQPAMPGMMGMAGGGVPVGRYLELPDHRVITTNHTFGLVDEPPSFWLDKEFFKISDLKSATLSENGEALWSVTRGQKAADFTLLGDVPEDKEPDNVKLNSLKSAFSWIRFNDVADPAAKPEDIGMDKPKVLTAIDFEGFVYTIRFGAPVSGKQYLSLNVEWKGDLSRIPAADEKPEDKDRLDAEFARGVKEKQDKAKQLQERLSPWTYEVGTYALTNVNKTFAELLKDKPKPAPAPEPENKDDDAAQAKDEPEKAPAEEKD
jgi:hypothetical protein